jgi:murein L,D-transpeptidase YcbB/YkuD
VPAGERPWFGADGCETVGTEVGGADVSVWLDYLRWTLAGKAGQKMGSATNYDMTDAAGVINVQRMSGLTGNGIVDDVTWETVDVLAD